MRILTVMLLTIVILIYMILQVVIISVKRGEEMMVHGHMFQFI